MARIGDRLPADQLAPPPATSIKLQFSIHFPAAAGDEVSARVRTRHGPLSDALKPRTHRAP